MALKLPQDYPYRPIVYVVQEIKGRNMSQALDFGSMECLLSWEDEATLLNVPRIVHLVKKKLAKFTRHDWLLLSGNPVSIAIAVAVASDLTGGEFNVLKWDQQEKRYLPLRINLRHLEP